MRPLHFITGIEQRGDISQCTVHPAPAGTRPGETSPICIIRVPAQQGRGRGGPAGAVFDIETPGAAPE